MTDPVTQVTDDPTATLAALLPHMTDDNPLPSGTMLGGRSVADWEAWYRRAAARLIAAGVLVTTDDAPHHPGCPACEHCVCAGRTRKSAPAGEQGPRVTDRLAPSRGSWESRYELLIDDPRFGLSKGDVLICESMHPAWAHEKVAVVRRESDSHEPRCSQYRVHVRHLSGPVL